MKIKRRTAALVAAVLLGIGGAVAVASPAFAEGDACPSLSICVWETANPGGTPPHYYWTSPQYTQCINFGSAINDQVVAMKLTWGYVTTLYEHAGCQGRAIASTNAGQFKNCNYSSWLKDPWWACNGIGASSIWYVAP